MQTELLSVSKIFTENLFRIPDYQRGYSWTQKQLKDFWNDIVQLEDGKNHYTGVLTLEAVPSAVVTQWHDDTWIIDSKHYSPYYVVDGQQRLTTVIILIQAILETLPDNQLLNYTGKDDIRRKFIFESKDGGISRSYIFGYEKDNPSYEFLKTDIFVEPSDKHSTAERTIYTHNLAAAKEFFLTSLAPMSHAELTAVYTKVTQNLLFNIYSISKDIDVFVAFETMNNRGKPLSHLELLKNRLIYLSTRFPTDSEERSKLRRVINECWKSAYHYLGKNENVPLDDDHFLETHFLLYFGPGLVASQAEDEKPDLRKYMREERYKEYLLEEVFTSKRLAKGGERDSTSLSVESVYQYAQHLKVCVRLYYEMFNPGDSTYPDDEKILLEQIRRLPHRSIPALLLAVYLTDEFDGGYRVKILRELERHLFVKSVVAYAPNVEEIDYTALAIDLVSPEHSMPDVDSVLSEHVGRILKVTSVVSSLMYKAKSNSYGYYGWRALKYFMFEYEQDLLAKSKTDRPKLSWDEFAGENFEYDYGSVEHIYPQKVTAECWKEVFQKYTVKERNAIKNSLGNLVPLSKPKNSTLRNNCFRDKCGDETNRVGYSYGCYSEIEVAQHAAWTAADVLKRGLRLLDFMERRWRISLGSPGDRVKALGLGFVLKKEGSEDSTAAPAG